MREMEIRETYADDSYISDLRMFMGEYADSKEEVAEALMHADQDGYVLEAVEDGKRVGMAVVIKMQFDILFPKYHLVYVTSDPKQRRKGIGEALVRRAVMLSGGDMSLHVSPKNSGAIELYKKAGLKESYIRMTSR
jgi:threonine synthase